MFFLIIPGIVYFAWRYMTEPTARCGYCQSTQVVPLDSPVARGILATSEPARISAAAAIAAANERRL